MGRHSRSVLFAALASSAVLLGAGTSVAGVLDAANGSFESIIRNSNSTSFALPLGEYTIGVGTAVTTSVDAGPFTTPGLLSSSGPRVFIQYAADASAYHGQNVLILGAGSSVVSVGQLFDLTPGAHSVSVQEKYRYNVPSVTLEFGVINSGAFVSLASNSVTATTSYSLLTTSYTATGSDAMLGKPLAYRLSSSADDAAFDSVRFTVPDAVPEPATLGVLCAGLAGLLLRRRHRSE